MIDSNSDAINDIENNSDFIVTVDSNNVDRAIKNLKRKLIREGYYRDIKLKRFYEKPTVRRKRKLKECIKRTKKDRNRGNMM